MCRQSKWPSNLGALPAHCRHLPGGRSGLAQIDPAMCNSSRLHNNGIVEDSAVRPHRRHAFAAAPTHPVRWRYRRCEIFLAGFAVLGLLAIGTVAPAMARPLSVPSVGPSLAVQQADWDGDRCGPRCWEHRREAREHEQEHQRWAQDRRWEEHQRSEESRYQPA